MVSVVPPEGTERMAVDMGLILIKFITFFIYFLFKKKLFLLLSLVLVVDVSGSMAGGVSASGNKLKFLSSFSYNMLTN